MTFEKIYNKQKSNKLDEIPSFEGRGSEGSDYHIINDLPIFPCYT